MKTKYSWQNKATNDLFKAILKLKNTKEAADFFRDLCTLEELEEMSKRWQAAKLLEKKYSYRKVAAKVGLSTATVTRIAHWLNYGRGGYKLILKRK